MSNASESPRGRPDDAARHSAGGDRTDIGVYTGTDTLIAAAPAQPTLGAGFAVDAAHVCERAEFLARATDALGFTPFDSGGGEAQVFAAVWHQIRPQLYEAAADLVAYLRRFDTPRIVLAEQWGQTATLWERRTADGTGAWLPTAARQAVTDRAQETEIPVVRVATSGRRDDCHHCGTTGAVDDGHLSCPGESCPVDRVSRGQNAAVHLARSDRHE